MRSLHHFLSRIAAAVRRDRLDDELREEIAHHIELRRQQLIDEGMNPRDADAAARRAFGNATKIREETRTMWSFPSVDTVLQDVRYGFRMLRRSPTFTFVSVLSLAIGIGATSAVFGLMDLLLFRKLPVPAPDQLVAFRWFSGPVMTFESLSGNFNQNADGFSSTSFSRAAFDALRDELSAQADVFGFAGLSQISLSIDGRPEIGSAQVVSGNYYSALGLAPVRGRFITDLDDRADAPLVGVISHSSWQRRFSGEDPVGRTVQVNGIPVEIVGVAPQGFDGTAQVGQRYDITLPMSAQRPVARSEDRADPNVWWMLMMARLKHGVRPEHVQPAAEVIVKRTTAAARPHLTAQDLPRVTLDRGARGQLEVRDSMREPLKAMALVVVIVLLVACANVANLLLARGRARRRELAVRVAIGAPRARVVRQLITEGCLLAALGSALGLLCAESIATALLPALTGSSLEVDVDWRVASFAILLAAASTLLFAVAPSIQSTDVRLASGLQESGRGASGARTRNGLAGALVVVQVGLSMLLMTAAALLAYSVRNLQHVDPGFDPTGIVIFGVEPQQNGYGLERTRSLYASALERLRALPGVRAASLSSHRLIAGSSSVGVARPVGTTAPERGSAEAQKFIAEHQAWRLVADDQFLNTMGIRLLAGRAFGSADTATSQQVAVINATLARQLFGVTTEAVGRRFILGMSATDPHVEVVGVAADAKYTSLRRDIPPTVYLSFRQRPIGAATFAVKVDGDPTGVAGSIREAMRQLDSSLPLHALRTQQEQILTSLNRERLFARLATLLGAVTLALAAIGLYGLLAYAVTRRTPEIGVRMALGAERAAVRWMILRQSAVLVAAGLVLGIAGALGSNSVIESMLFGLTPSSPYAIATAASIMLAVSLLASFIPAHRASRVDPVVALRTE